MKKNEKKKEGRKKTYTFETAVRVIGEGFEKEFAHLVDRDIKSSRTNKVRFTHVIDTRKEAIGEVQQDNNPLGFFIHLERERERERENTNEREKGREGERKRERKGRLLAWQNEECMRAGTESVHYRKGVMNMTKRSAFQSAFYQHCSISYLVLPYLSSLSLSLCLSLSLSLSLLPYLSPSSSISHPPTPTSISLNVHHVSLSLSLSLSR